MSVTVLRHQFSKQGDQGRVTISGSIDHLAQFPTLELTSLKTLVLDLKGITGLSSTGMRDWIFWLLGLEKANPAMNLRLENLAFVILRKMGDILRHLPRNLKITSFLMAFTCEHCNHSLDQAFKASDILLADGTIAKIPEPNCPKCGHRMQEELGVDFIGLASLLRK